MAYVLGAGAVGVELGFGGSPVVQLIHWHATRQLGASHIWL